MIRLHRLDGSPFVVNAELIETVEATPDTVLRLLNAKVYVVREPVDVIIERCVGYRRAVFAGLVGHPLGEPPVRWHGGDDAEESV
jgi:flagellar protein FlbD